MSQETIEKLLNATLDAGMSAKTDDFSKAIEAMEKKLKAVQKEKLAHGSGDGKPNQEKAKNVNAGNKVTTKKAKKGGSNPEPVAKIQKGKTVKEVSDNKISKPVLENKVQAKVIKKVIGAVKETTKSVKSAPSIDKAEKKAIAKKVVETETPKKSKKPKKANNSNSDSNPLTIHDMVILSIKTLGEKKGSDAKAIKNYITETYKNAIDEKLLPTTFQVNKTLLQAVEDKELTQNKKRFQLVAQASDKESPKAKSEKKIKPKAVAESTQLKRKSETENDMPQKKKKKSEAKPKEQSENESSKASVNVKVAVVGKKGTVEKGTNKGEKKSKKNKNNADLAAITKNVDDNTVDLGKAKIKKAKNSPKKIVSKSTDEGSIPDQGSDPELPQGWKREIVMRKGGESGGKQCDVYMYDPTGKKFRSRAQINKYFEENPDKQIPEEELDCVIKAFKRNPGELGKPPKAKAPKSSNNDSLQPKKPKKQIPLSPKAEMIVDAIKALGSKKGSDKKAIRNYIAEKYPGSANLKFVHKELKRCVDKGTLIAKRRFFKLPHDECETPKKKSKKKASEEKKEDKQVDTVSDLPSINNPKTVSKKKTQKAIEPLNQPKAQSTKGIIDVQSEMSSTDDGTKETKKVKKMKKKAKKKESVTNGLHTSADEIDLPME